ncbi:MAG: hypothetical protein WCT85_01165 [Parachlamydiales bacterium]|jgi:antitoxin component YwqK of YwqJK toxin-antitoxin module
MKPIYEFKDNILIIADPDLNINLTSDLPMKKQILYYDDKKILAELHYHKNSLHGSSIYYSKDHDVLSSSWFYLGKRYGRTYQYYLSKKPYSVLCYNEDLMDGMQTYYYENGQIKTLMNYKKGTLHGEVKLFYEDSKMKRFLIFDNGKKTQDNIFDENEVLVDEKKFEL